MEGWLMGAVGRPDLSRYLQWLRAEPSLVGESVTTLRPLLLQMMMGGRVRCTSCGIISLQKKVFLGRAKASRREKQKMLKKFDRRGKKHKKGSRNLREHV